MDTTLPNEMRVAAFIITMRTEPNLGVLKLITQHLKKEPSLHVGSFVYSYLKSTSELKTPVLRNMTTTIKTALKYAKPITPGFQYSKARINDVYSETFKTGMISSFEYLNNPRSILPEAIIYRQDYDILGFPFGGYEVCLKFFLLHLLSYSCFNVLMFSKHVNIDLWHHFILVWFGNGRPADAGEEPGWTKECTQGSVGGTPLPQRYSRTYPTPFTIYALAHS